MSDLKGGPGRTLPEAEVTVQFGSGLFASAELFGGLPRRYGLGSLVEPNPLATHLSLGVRVGYSFSTRCGEMRGARFR